MRQVHFVLVEALYNSFADFALNHDVRDANEARCHAVVILNYLLCLLIASAKTPRYDLKAKFIGKNAAVFGEASIGWFVAGM